MLGWIRIPSPRRRGRLAFLTFVALGAVLAAASLGSGRTLATSTYNFSPDCLFYSQSNPFSLSDTTCEFSVTSFSLTPANASNNDTTTASISWTDGRTPASDLNGNVGSAYPSTSQPQVVTLSVNWGDGTSSSYNLYAPSLDSATFPNLAANCDTQHIVDAGGGQLSCNTGLNAQGSPVAHHYSTAGSFTVSLTATLYLANICQFDLCPSSGNPPYYINSNASATAWSSQVTPTGYFTSAPPSVVKVGQPLSVSLHTDDADSTAYYNVHVGWDGVHSVQLDSGEVPAFGSMNWQSTFSGGWDDTLHQAYTGLPLQHTYTQVGTYTLYAQMAACTLPPAGNAPDCAQGPYNIGQGQSIPISVISETITVVPVPVTATIGGSQVYGSPAQSFTMSSNAGSGVTVAGAATCTTVDGGTPITAALSAGNHTIDPSSCSGLTSSDPTNHPLLYAGGTFTVKPGVVVSVSGSQTWGQNDEVLTYTAGASSPASGVTVSGTVTCTSVDGGMKIQGLTPEVGEHTVDPGSCSGVTASDPSYAIAYSGTYSVRPYIWLQNVSGTWTYGQSPSFSYTPVVPGPLSGTTGTISSCYVDVNDQPQIATSGLLPGMYPIDPNQGCTGLTLDTAFPNDVQLGYTGSVTILSSHIALTTGTEWTYGSRMPLGYVSTTPPGITLSGSVTCGTVDGGTAIGASLPAGTHAIDGSTCGGLTASAPGYTIDYSGTIVVDPATPTVGVSGGPYTYNGAAHGVVGAATGVFGEPVSGTILAAYGTFHGSAPVNAGTYSVQATFTSLDPNYTNGSGTGSITINPAAPTIAIGGGPFTYNTLSHAATATALGVDGVTPVSGTFALTYSPGGSTPPATAGAYGVSAAFTSSDPNYTNGSGTGSITINAASATTSVVSSVNPSIVGQPVTFTATVSAAAGSPTGTVQFKVDGSNFGSPVALVGGQATLANVASLGVGTHSVTAAYSGDTNFGGSNGGLSQKVQYRIVALYSQTAKWLPLWVPITIQIQNYAGANLSSSAVHVTLASPSISRNPAPGTAPTGSFTFVPTRNGGFYVFNVKAWRYPTGTYTLYFTVTGDPMLHSVQFAIR